MIHGVFYRSDKHRPQLNIWNGTDPVLNIDPIRQKIITWSDDHCWLAQSINKQEVSQLFSESHSHLQIVAWARLDNPKELCNKLGIQPNDMIDLSDAQIILRAYLYFGEACTEHLYGDFCFAIYNQQTQTLLCVRDQMGARPFYYYSDNDVFAFSSSLALFHALDCVSVKPSIEWVSKFLVPPMSMDFRKTAYQNIFKLPPAHQCSTSKASINEKQYFVFHTNKIQLSSSQEYVEYYQTELERAIKSRCQTQYPLGTEMSGGLDSSTVTAYSAKYFPGPLSDFYTFGFARLPLEPTYSLQVNQRYKITNGYICCGNTSHLYDQNRALQALGAPIEHAIATGHEIFYDTASKHQIRTLLSGFGGDEFVTSIHGHLYLYELLKNKKHITLYNTLLGNPVMRALRLAKLHYCSGHHNAKMRPAYESRWSDVIIADDVSRAYRLQEQYEYLGNFDSGYHSLDQFMLEKRLAPFVSTRMENCTLIAATYGIEYRWPLLDTQLIQCFLSIPSSEKYYRGIDRYLHKRAIQDTVPKDIVWKQGKYMGEPVNKSAPEQLVLNNDLHPDLLPLLNMEKLKNQATQFPQLKSTRANQVKRNVRKINQLDDWLKYFFKKGCDWGG